MQEQIDPFRNTIKNCYCGMPSRKVQKYVRNRENYMNFIII